MKPSINQSRIDRLEQMKNMLVAEATGGSSSDSHYSKLREELIRDPVIANRLPQFVRNCRSLFEFWGFIKHKFSTYRERREFLWNEFNPIILFLESQSAFPSDAVCAAVIGRPDRAHVHDQWVKALARRDSDPAGAITAARSLLETVCKSIMHEAGRGCQDEWDLPRLYREVAELLNLAPSQHTELIFKKILGGCHAVIEGLGAIRNRDGDAHGSSPLRAKPSPRHAQLAVNLAFATATFLIETWEERSAKTPLTGVTSN